MTNDNVKTLRLQPVEPEYPPTERLVNRVIWTVAFSFLTAALVMLAAQSANKYWADFPAFGYWDSWFMLLGLSSVSLVTLGKMRPKWPFSS